jgi:DNA-binding ferritin-like protein
MREHIALAEKRGDPGTAELLRDHLEDLEADAHVIEQLLEDETLVRAAVLRER